MLAWWFFSLIVIIIHYMLQIGVHDSNQNEKEKDYYGFFKHCQVIIIFFVQKMMMKNYNFFHSIHSIHLLFWYICQTFFVVVAVHDWMNESWLKLNSLWNEWRLTEWMNETYKYSWHEYSLSLMNDNDDSDDDARIRFLRIQQLEFRFFVCMCFESLIKSNEMMMIMMVCVVYVTVSISERNKNWHVFVYRISFWFNGIPFCQLASSFSI